MWNRSKAQPTCPPSHDRYALLAEAIERRISELALQQDKAPDAVVDAVMNELTGKGLAEEIRTSWRELPPLERWERLVALFPEPIVRAALEAERERVAAMADPARRVAILAREARDSGILDLEQLLPGMQLKISLYTDWIVQDAQDEPWRVCSSRVARELTFEVVEGTMMRLRTIVTHQAYSSSPRPEARSILQVGAHVGGNFRPYVQLGKRLVCKDGQDIDVLWDRDRRRALVLVGRALLDEQEVFWDPQAA